MNITINCWINCSDFARRDRRASLRGENIDVFWMILFREKCTTPLKFNCGKWLSSRQPSSCCNYTVLYMSGSFHADRWEWSVAGLVVLFRDIGGSKQNTHPLGAPAQVRVSVKAQSSPASGPGSFQEPEGLHGQCRAAVYGEGQLWQRLSPEVHRHLSLQTHLHPGSG